MTEEGIWENAYNNIQKWSVRQEIGVSCLAACACLLQYCSKYTYSPSRLCDHIENGRLCACIGPDTYFKCYSLNNRIIIFFFKRINICENRV